MSEPAVKARLRRAKSRFPVQADYKHFDVYDISAMGGDFDFLIVPKEYRRVCGLALLDASSRSTAEKRADQLTAPANIGLAEIFLCERGRQCFQRIEIKKRKG